MQTNLLERVNTQNLQSPVQASGRFQLLVQDGYKQICRHGDPNLGFHRIEAGSIAMLDPQVAFNKIKCVTLALPLLSMINNMMSKLKTPLTG
jgi:hypothetical protein